MSGKGRGKRELKIYQEEREKECVGTRERWMESKAEGEKEIERRDIEGLCGWER